MSQEPINIAGVCAFLNPNGVRDMRFVDCNYNTLFRLPSRRFSREASPSNNHKQTFFK